MKKILLAFVTFLLVQFSFAQNKYFTKTGTMSLNAGTGVEEMEGINKSVTSVFDATTGQMEFALLIKGIEFKRALMQEHFNENYMESDKFPKSTFKGKITNLSSINFAKDGTYPVTVKGILDMHGVKKEMEATGSFKVVGQTITSTSNFSLVLAEYKIAIPNVVKDKIAKTVKIKVNCNYTILTPKK